MAEASNLIEKYTDAATADPYATTEFRQSIINFKPDWDSMPATRALSGVVGQLAQDEAALVTLKKLQEAGVAQSLFEALGAGDEKLSQWILTLFYDMLRSDSSCYCIFEDGRIGSKALVDLVGAKADAYSADKAAWLATSVMGNVPGIFTEADAKTVLASLLGSNSGCTDLGVLEAITNLLKADSLRGAVWSTAGVPERVFKVQPTSGSQNHLYRCVFAIWMLSFDKEIPQEFNKHDCLPKLKSVLTSSRTEKVVRLTLTVLRNLLQHKALCEVMVEANVLESVQNLEYEKWRDSELYDEIRETSQLISNQVQEHTNMDRYEKELKTGKLHWGFVHSSKFWAENVFKFEANDFKALKQLATLLIDETVDSTTKAVACHDFGEFVTLHPLGKKKVGQLGVKDRVMYLMGSAEDRDLRREALLCCQKIMLHKWQDIESKK